MRNLLRNLKPYWKTVILLIALLMVQAYCDMALPQYTQDIIDTGIQNKGTDHILPERQPADEYRAVQIFMTKGEKKEWQSIYEKSGTYYKLKVTDEKRLEKLDEKFMTPVVLTYQLGHTSVKTFKKTVKRSLKQNGFGAAGSSGAQKKAQEEMLKKIDAMSLSEMEKTFHMDIRSFRAKDENGRMKTYVDMRSIMGDMIRKGTMDDAQIRKAKRQMQKTIDSVGSETLKAMGMDDRSIAGVFLRVAAKVVARGMLIGNAVALLFCLVQHLTHFVHLNPDNYFVSYVPVRVDLPQLLLVDALAFAAIMLIMLLPSLFIARVDPADTVRVK